MSNEVENTGKILIYQNEKGDTKIDVYFEEDTIWMTQRSMAELYQVTPQNITTHIKHIYEDGELEQRATCKSYLQVQMEGNRQIRRDTKFYNLDMILAVGYRVRSNVGIHFRRWASGVLTEYMKKGFAFMCILDTKQFFLWLADFLFVLVRNVGLLVVDAVADIGFIFQNFLYLTV